MTKALLIICLTGLLFPAFIHAEKPLNEQALLEEKYRSKIDRLIKGIYGEERKSSVEVTVFSLENSFEMENRETYKLTAAVFVDGEWHFEMNAKNRFIIDNGGIRKRTCVLLNKKQTAELEEAVRLLIGYDEKRGDHVRVSSIQFDRTEHFRQVDGEWKKGAKKSSTIMTFFLVLFFMVVGITVYRVITKDIEYRRKLREDELERDFILRAGEKKRYR